MAINHRASAISIGCISIIFAVISIAKNAQYSKEDFADAVRKLGVEMKDQALIERSESLADFLSITSKVGIAFAGLLIITSAMLFAVVQQYMRDNKERKYFLLPYVVVNLLLVIADVIITIIMANKFSGFTILVTAVMVIMVIDILIRILFGTLMAVYYRFLTNYQGYN